MIPQIKRIVSSDVDIETYVAEEGDDFLISVQAEIGPDNENGADIFNFVFFSNDRIPRPARFEHEIAQFNKRDVLDFINKKLSAMPKTCDWSQAAAFINAFSIWEYDGYS
jgi:hypothetical protein